MRKTGISAHKKTLLKILPIILFLCLLITPFVNWSGKDYLAPAGGGNDEEQNKIIVKTDADLSAYFEKAYPESKREMLISFMSGPTPSEEAAQIMKDCGINTAFTWSYSRSWDNLCNIYGIDYMPFLYGQSPADHNSNLSPSNLSGAVCGFNYGDEPIYNQIANMEELAENHAKYYGNKLFYWNLLGKFPDGDQQYMNGHTYEEYVQQYCDVVFKYVTQNRYISTDVYPLEYFETGDTVKYTIKNSWLPTYELFGIKARDYEATFNFYVANRQHYNYRQLDETSLRYMVNVGLSYGAKSLSYFEYAQDPGEWGNGLVGKDGTTIYPEYYMAQTVNHELLSWDHVLLNFDYQITQLLTGTLNNTVNGNFGSCVYNVDKLPDIEKSVSDRDTIISHFKGKYGENGYMITNFEDPVNEVETDSVKLVFENKNITKAVVFKNGKRSIVTIENGEYNVTLGKGEMVFVIPYDLDELNGTVEENIEQIGDPEEEVRGIYTIKFETYCDEKIEPIKVNRGEILGSVKEISKVGYDFVGWYYDFDLYDFNAPVEKSMVLDARFVPRKDIPYSVKIYVEEQDGVWTDRSKLYKGMLGRLEGTTDTEYDISAKARVILNELGDEYCFDSRVKGSVTKDIIKGDGSTEYVLYYPKFREPSLCPYNVSFSAGSSYVNLDYDNTIAFGNETFSYKFTTTSYADPRIYFNQAVLDLLPEHALGVSFYIYHEITDYTQYRLITDNNNISSTTAIVKASIPGGVWNKITITVDELRLILDENNNGSISIMRWNPYDEYYLSGLYVEPSLERNVEEGFATITFDTDGAGVIETQKVVIGEKAEKPQTPKKKGYKFVGWYNDYTLFNFDQVVNYDVRLKAIWEEYVIEQNNFQIEGVNGETVVKTDEITYGEEDYSYKLSSSNWDAKFKFTDLVNLTDSNVTFYIYSNYGGEDYQNLRLFTGANDAMSDTGIYLVKGEWTEVTLTASQFNNMLNLGYAIQLRTDSGNLASEEFYISIIPETKCDLFVVSNGNTEVNSEKVYGEEEYSVKLNSNSATADAKIFFNEKLLDSMPNGTTTVRFYIYHEHGVEIPFQYIQNSPASTNFVAMLKSGEWTEVIVDTEQFVNAIKNNDNYYFRMALGDACDYYLSYPQFSEEENEKLQIELVSAGTIEKDREFTHGSDRYSYKITPGAWDIKFTFADVVNITDSDVTFYIYSTFDKSDYADLRLFYGPANGTVETGIYLEKNAWTEVTISKTWFNNMVNLGYVLQVRTDSSHVTGYNYWISMIPETSSNEYVISNGVAEKNTQTVFENEEYSMKVNSGSSSADCKFFFDKSLLNEITSETTTVRFRIYHEHGSDIQLQYIQTSPWNSSVVAVLKSGEWTEVVLDVQQFITAIENSDNYHFRAALWEACDYYVSHPVFSNEAPEKLKVELVSNGLVEKDNEFTYGNEEYSYKITPTSWDIKFKFSEGTMLTDCDVTFYIYSNYAGSDYEVLRIFIGPQNKLLDQGIYIPLNSWMEFTLTKDQFNEIVSYGYVIQFRTDNNISGYNYWISMIPETSSDEWITTNGTVEKSDQIKYGNEEYSIKLNSGSSAIDLRTYFNKVSQSYIPEGATTVKFYIYHEYGEDINFQFLNNDEWTKVDIATLETGKWTEVELSIEDFLLLCENPTNFCLRAQLWDSCDYYISQLYFE